MADPLRSRVPRGCIRGVDNPVLGSTRRVRSCTHSDSAGLLAGRSLPRPVEGSGLAPLQLLRTSKSTDPRQDEDLNLAPWPRACQLHHDGLDAVDERLQWVLLRRGVGGVIDGHPGAGGSPDSRE